MNSDEYKTICATTNIKLTNSGGKQLHVIDQYCSRTVLDAKEILENVAQNKLPFS